MKKLLSFLCIGATGIFAFTGCIHTHETVYEDATRMKVEFESEQAAHTFYEALSKQPPANRNANTTHVSIPLVFEHTRTKTVTSNVTFNDAVRRADTNQDGKITELEAKIFAGQR